MAMRRIISRLNNHHQIHSKSQFQHNEKIVRIIDSRLEIPRPEFDTEFICNPANRDLIARNIEKRKGVGNIDKILELSKNNKSQDENFELQKELSKIPNMTEPNVLNYPDEGIILKEYGTKPNFDFKPKNFSQLASSLKLVRMEDLGPIAGEKGYILIGDLAQMEEALVQYSIRRLMKRGFKLVSVPDILPSKVIERCGLIVDSKRTLVYSLDNHYGDDLSLSGTSEMSLASKLMNSKISYQELPLKLAAVSRCFRAEISNSSDEHGIYRVHQFTKVEMFVCSTPDKSAEMLEELADIQVDLFKDLGLNFKVIDMASHELGAQASRKLDIEGWLPGKKTYGELSSCSNCTDYQSRRLNIKFQSSNSNLKHVHTLNGTACAIPRMLMAICETFQSKEGTIKVPDILVPFMNGRTEIKSQKIGDMRDYKFKPRK